MKLLIVRHAPAGDREQWSRTGRPDSARPLTVDGAKLMRRAARGLKRLGIKPSLVVSSPLARAEQTARILLDEIGLKAPLRRVRELEPEADPDRLVSWLRGRKERLIAVVGHEPALSGLASLLLTGEQGAPARLRLKKGQACVLGFEARPVPGAAELLWSLTPRQLARL